MRAKTRDLFTSIRTEGGLLPADLLVAVAKAEDRALVVTPDAYNLVPGERLGEAIGRAWNQARGLWAAFQAAREKLPPEDPGLKLTRERWLLPLFDRVLGYGPLQAVQPIVLDEKDYALSHRWRHAPIHLLGSGVPLDRRSPGVAGADRTSPHGLVQELLNRSDDHLWAFVSNGLQLRVLRDNKTLTRQAFVEFDLETMMQGEVYADFALFWLVCHPSRVDAERPEQCALERWSKEATERGTRALDQLRVGVEEAIKALGTGFLAHDDNGSLRQRLQSGALTREDLYRQLLRVVYRLLFLFVAADRDLLADPKAAVDAKRLYREHYSTARLRALARKMKGSPHHDDLWRALLLVFAKLDVDGGCPELGLPALGSFLWSKESIAGLLPVDAPSLLSNAALLDAVRALAFIVEKKVRRAIDFKNLGAEELGSVYESLLELSVDVNVDARTFELRSAAGNERKTTGSYYTPEALIQELLDSALEPVIDEAVKKPDAEAAILALKVCDPACGSGHFLIAAAHRLARRLASVRTGDAEPAPEAMRTALRDVIGHCIYGVDINELAVELCKIGLWVEALEPGKPLSFLDARIQCGNSLIGATPALLKRGIPDEAFEPIEGDDKKVCSAFTKRNKAERVGDVDMFAGATEPWMRIGDLATELLKLDAVDDDSVEGVKEKQRRYAALVSSVGYKSTRLWVDAFCAAFFWKKTQPEIDAGRTPITEDVFRLIEKTPAALDRRVANEVERLAREGKFFHWHIAFPDVFPPAVAVRDQDGPGWDGGFDCVVGNPPWVSFTGRQKVSADPHEVAFLLATFPETTRWPSTHGAFFLRACQLCSVGARLGLVLPRQVSELAAYDSVRTAVSRSCADLTIDYIGEDAFPGVTQPAALYSGQRSNVGAPWPSDTSAASGNVPLIRTGSSDPSGGELDDVIALPRFPPRTFLDPGVHTGNVAAKIILDSVEKGDARFAPVREGKDIVAYWARAPRRWLWVEPDLVGDEYCRIRDHALYVGLPIVIRQTANRPIATRHLEPTYFRNSLLACRGVDGTPHEVVVAVLNSSLVAHLHRRQFADSGQKVFPQVKVQHLQSLPFPPSLRDGSRADLAENFVKLVHAAERAAAVGNLPIELVRAIEELVLLAYGLPGTLATQFIEEAG